MGLVLEHFHPKIGLLLTSDSVRNVRRTHSDQDIGKPSRIPFPTRLDQESAMRKSEGLVCPRY